ncbi:uncharacterized protein [Nicotiana tomentosiformis]|uniref:uncharacterized protein n=1 Tax=Nicotiana tomentosiformis TaxID=4098 RepID=UPI00388CDEF2
MRCTKWSSWWKPDEKTHIAIPWISFLDLPPNFFGKDFVFSLANDVGRSLHIDLATQNGTIPSCAKVKVEVNLLAIFPQRIKIIEEEDETGPKESKWIKIKYDYMPKYCKTCKKQGHNEKECWIIHPELHKKFKEEGEDQNKEKAVVMQGEVIGTAAASTKVLASEKVRGKPAPSVTKNEWMQRRKNKYQRDSRVYIIDNEEVVSTEPTYDHRESTGKGATSNVAGTGKEEKNDPVKISNQFALLEKGEIEIQKQIKKEAVEKVLNKEKNEAKKANPSSIGKTSPENNEVQIMEKVAPNPTVIGI